MILYVPLLVIFDGQAVQIITKIGNIAVIDVSTTSLWPCSEKSPVSVTGLLLIMILYAPLVFSQALIHQNH